MYPRLITQYLQLYSQQYPCVTVTGPRQSGKTTLVKNHFSNYHYVSLEDPDLRYFATSDPRGFLAKYNDQVIFDEVQKTPDLFSYIQTYVDNYPKMGRFILTGSQNFTLSKSISQSLAGRTAICRLLPFSLSELHARRTQTSWFGKDLVKQPAMPTPLHEVLFTGMYPGIYEHHLSPMQFYRDYVETYVTRDMRDLLQVNDLHSFENFLRLLAGRSGQLLNLSSLANDVGVAHNTVKRWISILETSYIVFLLQPYHRNFNKRIVKSPKCYFLDTGLLCYLLGLRQSEDIHTHPLRGNIFETFVVGEVMKTFFCASEIPPVYFWRDKTGNEIDLMVDLGNTIIPIEIKLGKTVNPDYFSNIHKWKEMSGSTMVPSYVVYGGEEWRVQHDVQVIPWFWVS